MKVFILTEGSQNIGLGHVARCTALYDAFSESKFIIKFYIAGDSSVNQITQGRPFKTSNWYNEVIKEIQPKDIVIIDSYIAKLSVYQKIAAITTKTLYLDDYNRLDYPQGVILNSALKQGSSFYQSLPGRKYLLGQNYALLRKEFGNVSRKIIKKKVTKIMLTFGSSDPHNLTPQALRVLVKNYPSIIKNVLIGPGYTCVADIKSSCDSNTNLIHSPSGEDIIKIILDSDIAISSGGQTLNELAKIGTPAIVIMDAENQNLNINSYEQSGFINFIGKWDDKNIIANLQSNIHTFLDYETRKAKSKIGQNLVDGLGSHRIVEYLSKGRIEC